MADNTDALNALNSDIASELTALEPNTKKVAIDTIEARMRELKDRLYEQITAKEAKKLNDEFDTLFRDRAQLKGQKAPGSYGKTIEERVTGAAKKHGWKVKRLPGRYPTLDLTDHFDESKLDLRSKNTRYKVTTPQGQHRVVDAFREAAYSRRAKKRILPGREGLRIDPVRIRGGPYKPSYEAPQPTGEAKLLKSIRRLEGSVLPEGGAHLRNRGASLREYEGRDKARQVRAKHKAARAAMRTEAHERFQKQMEPVQALKQKHGPKTKGPLRVNIEDIAAKQKDWWPGHERHPVRTRGTVVRGYHGTGFDVKTIKPVFHFGTRKSAMDRLEDQAPGSKTKRLLEVQVRSNRMSGTPMKPLSEGILERQDMMYLKPHKLKQMPRQLKKADLAYYLNDVEDAGSTTAVAMKPSRVKVKDVTQVGTELPTRAGMKMLSEAEAQAKALAKEPKVHPTRQRTEKIRIGEHPAKNMGKHEDTAAKAITKYKKNLGFENKTLAEVNMMEDRLTVEQEYAASKTFGKKEHTPAGGPLEPLERAELKAGQKRLSEDIRKSTPIREPSAKLLKQQAPEVGRLASPSAHRTAAAGDVVSKGLTPKLKIGGLAAGLVSGIPAALGEAGEHRMRQEARKKQGLKPEAYSTKDFLRFMRERVGMPAPTRPRDMGI